MADRDPMVHIRMPAELRDRLQAAGRDAARSMNAEIVHRLETSFMTEARVSTTNSSKTAAYVSSLIDQRNKLSVMIRAYENNKAELEDAVRKSPTEDGNALIMKYRASIDRYSAALRETERQIVSITEQGELL